MITFNKFVHKHNLRNKATSNIKKQQFFNSIGLNNNGIFLRDGPFSSNIGIVNLHASKGTDWVRYKNENYFDIYACVPLKKLSKIFIKREGCCLYFEYQIQKIDSFCARFFLFKIYLTKIVGIDFKSALLNLYYHKNS